MTTTAKAGSFWRRGIPLVLNALIVLGLTLSVVPAGASLAVASSETRLAAPEGEPGFLAAPKRARKRAERTHDRQQHDRKKDRKKQSKRDRQQEEAGKDRKNHRPRDSKPDGQPAKNGQHPRKLETGRLPAAEAVAQAAGNQLNAEDRYIVVLDATSGDALAAANDIAATTAGVIPTHVYRHLFDGFAAVIPGDKLDEVRNNPRVQSVVPDDVVYADAQPLPAGIDRVDADLDPTARIDGIDDRVDIDVAVIDSAGDGFHPDLNIWAYANCTDRGDIDDNGHGTHVGGTIGALDNGVGVVGVAPGARLWNIRVLRAAPDGGAGGMTSWIICGLDIVAQYATDQGDGLGDIEVANAGLGGNGADGSCQSSAYHLAYCNVVAAGIPVVVSAGNDAVDAATKVPAAYDEVITVSALADSNGQPGGGGPATSAGPDDTLAIFSNFGADIDIAAPGADVLSTVPTGSCELCDPRGYLELNGTSMASPHVAGAAALYLATHPGATPAQVKAALLSTRELIALPGDPDGINEGVLDLAQTPPPAPPAVTPPPPSVDASPPPDPVQDTHKKHKKNKNKKKNKKKH